MNSQIKASDFFLPSNLMSLIRILITPLIAWLAIRPIEGSSVIALCLLIVAGMTDFLDGYLARRLNQVTRLGLILDPLADKILAVTLIITLSIAGDFPLWLGIMIIGRDAAILSAGLIVSRRTEWIPSSDIIGKYYFGSIAFLLASFLIDFEFGKQLYLITTTVFWGLSSINYLAIFINVIKYGQPLAIIKGRIVTGMVRVVAVVVVGFTLYRFYTDILS